MSFSTYEKPYKMRLNSPGISIYVVPAESREMDTVKCIYCGRPFGDIKGAIDKMISIPLDIREFDIAINIRCKLCKQHYRLITIG